jgi:hypothetical protein
MHCIRMRPASEMPKCGRTKWGWKRGSEVNRRLTWRLTLVRQARFLGKVFSQ